MYVRVYASVFIYVWTALYIHLKSVIILTPSSPSLADKHTGEEEKARAEDKFQEIAEAYEVLSDEESRYVYITVCAYVYIVCDISNICAYSSN